MNEFYVSGKSSFQDFGSKVSWTPCFRYASKEI